MSVLKGPGPVARWLLSISLPLSVIDVVMIHLASMDLPYPLSPLTASNVIEQHRRNNHLHGFEL